MISVSWSDQTEVIVYRSFQDFRKFHVSTLMHISTTAIDHNSNHNINNDNVNIYSEASEEEVPSPESFPEK